MDKKAREKIASVRSKPATFQIGKKGLTKEVLAEIKTQLKGKEVVKGKIYSAAYPGESRKNLLERLAGEVKPDAFEIRGNTIIVYKKKPKDFKKV